MSGLTYATKSTVGVAVDASLLSGVAPQDANSKNRGMEKISL
ncbi:hypothetical protein GPLA_0346 [Paraglaciecola polaris LMG 21857]|uniref:Uncharacterized protein n=1 Tax=Paraglaciecola polaris LMG 21857 TaxID=1129793 RepID=K7A755_9ALTE|nr:hypothetical protein GPLA_0346 [Paraglaciecola polaris LMG 21857]